MTTILRDLWCAAHFLAAEAVARLPIRGCMAGDGQIARKLHPVRFLGRTVRFAPGAVKLARLSGAPLLPLFWVPEGEGAAALEIGPPIHPGGDGDGDTVRCLQAFADALDERVRRWPHAYRNWHMLGDAM